MGDISPDSPQGEKERSFKLPATQDAKVYMDGVFDLVHSGHFNAMRQASTLGKSLCVGVNTDEEIVAAKGAAPILSTSERQYIIDRCRWVTETIESPYETTLDFLTDVAKCDFVAHGDDLVVGASGQDCYREPRAAGRFRVFKRTLGVSSTAIICRLLLAAREQDLLTAVEVSGIQLPELPERPIGSPIDGRRLAQFIGRDRTERFDARIRRHTPTNGENFTHMAKVVYCSGAFDVLCAEIVEFLERCKQLGTYLIVGTYDDPIVRRINGRLSPILSQTERMMNLYALKMVDEVVLNAPFNPDPSFLNRYGIQVVVSPVLERATKPAFAINGRKDSEHPISDGAAEQAALCEHVTIECDHVNNLTPLLLKVAKLLKTNQLASLDRRQQNDGTNLQGDVLVEL